ncbi:MAG TPA: nucleotidyltransferase domain-containing protein [Pelobium sp.]|nr:nucleotidyltransferase domain-containing protein [Pelobium sp.]
MTDFGLTKEEIKSIQNVFTNYEDIKTVTIYGSRAKGTHKSASDIDITLKGHDINLELQKKLEFELDDLMLPYKFDVTIYDKLTNPEFVAHIDRVGKEFYKRTSANK